MGGGGGDPYHGGGGGGNTGHGTIYIYILSHYLYYLILSGRCSTLNLLPICSSFRGMSVHSSEGKTETPTVLLHCQKNAL